MEKCVILFSLSRVHPELIEIRSTQNFDYARMRAFVHWFPSLILNGTRLGLGASHYHYIKEIPIGTHYEVRVNIVGWEEKWIHLVAQFVTYPKKRGQDSKEVQGRSKAEIVSSSTSAGGFTPPTTTNTSALTPFEGVRMRRASLRRRSSDAENSLSSPPDSTSSSDTEDDGLFESASQSSSGSSTPPTSVGSTSPVMKTARVLGEAGLAAASSSLASHSVAEAESSGVADAKALPPLPEGAVLHCVHVSSYCFKQSRITVPPRVALVAAGFGDPAVGRADRVKQITNTLSPLPSLSNSRIPAPYSIAYNSGADAIRVEIIRGRRLMGSSRIRGAKPRGS